MSDDSSRPPSKLATAIAEQIARDDLLQAYMRVDSCANLAGLITLGFSKRLCRDDTIAAIGQLKAKLADASAYVSTVNSELAHARTEAVHVGDLHGSTAHSVAIKIAKSVLHAIWVAADPEGYVTSCADSDALAKFNPQIVQKEYDAICERFAEKPPVNIDDVLALLAELELEWARAQHNRTTTPTSGRSDADSANYWIVKDEYCVVRFAGQQSVFKNTKGQQRIMMLLKQRKVHIAELSGDLQGLAGARGVASGASLTDTRADDGFTGVGHDRTEEDEKREALRKIHDRIQEINQSLEKLAPESCDERNELEQEKQQLRKEVQEQLNIRGCPRTSSATQRERQLGRLKKDFQRVCAKIREQNRSLAQHIEQSIHFDEVTDCYLYEPGVNPDWDFQEIGSVPSPAGGRSGHVCPQTTKGGTWHG